MVMRFIEDGPMRVNDKLKSLFRLSDFVEIRYHLGVLIERKSNAMCLYRAACYRVSIKPFVKDMARSPTSPMDDKIDSLSE